MRPKKLLRFKPELGFTTSTFRSALMKRIKGKDTKTEVLLRRELWKRGFRYRVNVKKLPGCPDLVFGSKKVVVFVDGEFWHGYEWAKKKKRIKANRKFWIPKIEANIARDRRNNVLLKSLGFKVIRFWEHELKADLKKCLKKVIAKLQ